MATWGPGIFDSDLAVKLRTEFNAALAAGQNPYTAGDKLKAAYADVDTMIVDLALAALQAEHNVIGTKIKKKALTLIILGEALERWNGDPAQLEQRKQALEALRARLLAIPT